MFKQNVICRGRDLSLTQILLVLRLGKEMSENSLSKHVTGQLLLVLLSHWLIFENRSCLIRHVRIEDRDTKWSFETINQRI